MKELELEIKEMKSAHSEKIKILEAVHASAGSINMQNKENLRDFQIDLVQGVEKALREQKLELMRHFVFVGGGGGTEVGGAGILIGGGLEPCETPEILRNASSDVRFSIYFFSKKFFLEKVFPSMTIFNVLICSRNF